ncbi:MAG: o-succinylbenzoate synthase, partial [Vicinamibacteria bacterium]
MNIERVQLRLLTLPLVGRFETSFGRTLRKDFILVRLQGEGYEGYGECVADANPYYSAETTETSWHVLEQFIAPRILGVSFTHPREVFPALGAMRGHNMAKAALEMAAWDLFARQQGQPLARVLGGTRDRIASGVSIGIQSSLDELANEVERELRAGYRRIKIK